MRAKKPIVIIDAYYDGDGKALCPAATGFTHHISPWGDIEPCPIMQFAKESIHRRGDPRPLKEKFLSSAFLRDFRELAAETTRGCIVLERPDLLKQLVEAHGAKDATARQTALAELAAMTPRPSQYNPGGGDPREERPLSPRQAILLQRLRRLRRPRRPSCTDFRAGGARTLNKHSRS